MPITKEHFKHSTDYDELVVNGKCNFSLPHYVTWYYKLEVGDAIVLLSKQIGEASSYYHKYILQIESSQKDTICIERCLDVFWDEEATKNVNNENKLLEWGVETLNNLVFISAIIENDSLPF